MSLFLRDRGRSQQRRCVCHLFTWKHSWWHVVVRGRGRQVGERQWEPPRNGFFKLNVDGGFNVNRGASRCFWSVCSDGGSSAICLWLAQSRQRVLSGNSWSQFCTEMWMSEYSGGELLCRDDEEAWRWPLGLFSLGDVYSWILGNGEGVRSYWAVDGGTENEYGGRCFGQTWIYFISTSFLGRFPSSFLYWKHCTSWVGNAMKLSLFFKKKKK